MRLVVRMAVLILVLIVFIPVVLAENPPKDPISLVAPAKIDTAKTYWQVSRDAWLKDTSSAEGKKICKIAKGSILVELDREGKWIKIEGFVDDSTSYQGYIYRNYLKKYPPVEKKKKNKSE